MTIGTIIKVILGATICFLISGGTQLIWDWYVTISNRRFDKKMELEQKQKEDKK